MAKNISTRCGPEKDDICIRPLSVSYNRVRQIQRQKRVGETGMRARQKCKTDREERETQRMERKRGEEERVGQQRREKEREHREERQTKRRKREKGAIQTYPGVKG